jgi:tetratricopeptide (TPR) repeat protein
MHSLVLAVLMSLLSQNPVNQAKGLTHDRNYEQSLGVLKDVQPTPEQYNEYCFIMAVNYFALNDRENASKWLESLLNSFHPMDSRHANVAYLMEEDLKKWKDGDMNDIGRDMRIAGDKLQNVKAGEDTQKVQKQIINKLDKLIKDQEDKEKAAKDAADAQASKGEQGTPGSPNGQGDSPAQHSQLPTDGGIGKVTEKELKKLAENWGNLPPAKREKAIQEITRQLPSKYRAMIEEYFKALNKIEPSK